MIVSTKLNIRIDYIISENRNFTNISSNLRNKSWALEVYQLPNDMYGL